MDEYIEREYLLDLYKGFDTPEYERLSVPCPVVYQNVLDVPAADVVEVDAVCEMLDYMLGDCPCNYSPTNEWLPEVCELQDECPNPKEKYGCWRQFIKHFRSMKMDGGANDAAD